MRLDDQGSLKGFAAPRFLTVNKYLLAADYLRLSLNREDCAEDDIRCWVSISWSQNILIEYFSKLEFLLYTSCYENVSKCLPLRPIFFLSKTVNIFFFFLVLKEKVLTWFFETTITSLVYCKGIKLFLTPFKEW